MPTRILKKTSTCDDDGSTSWSSLVHDLLLLIMTRVGFFDFIAFSGVCKSWRSVALSTWNKFMVSKQPMVFTMSTHFNKKYLYLEDYSRRKLKKNVISHFYGRVCVGVTYGYLIFYGQKTRDFWLVNPFTRKELHFPHVPLDGSIYPPHFRGILVFSPSMSGWVFVVVLDMYTNVISFSLEGEQARWRNIYISRGSCIRDLHFFKGKLYILDNLTHLWELRLNPEPTLTLHKMENFPERDFIRLEFVSSGENLYVWDVAPYVCLKVDFDEMKWVSSERTIGEYAVFVNRLFRCAAAIKPDTWTHPWTQYKRRNFSKSKIIDRCSTKYMWYYPHECLKDNDSDMENGALLNRLEESSKKMGGCSRAGTSGVSNAVEDEEKHE